jgi:molybdopterin-containing oxidoreductase family membrane subunit
MTLAVPTQAEMHGHAGELERWTLPGARTYEDVNALVTAPLLVPGSWTWRAWWIGFAISLALTLTFLVCIFEVFSRGLGIWGVNSVVVWGFAIANYVWWIGIGNAGTLISAMLLLTRQKWRASTNRFAEAMTLFAAAIAGIFPIIHLGRPLYFYWLTPYPNTMTVWPQWRSALIWDFWAILSYLLFSIIFWYVGLIPDLATLRDRAKARVVRKIYGAFALGWRGSVRHWHAYETLHMTLACLGVPLVVSLHSVVGMDFAASLMPGWQETIFPPYFVVGAMYSGFAMVVCLAALVRWGFRLQALITIEHFDVMAKIMLMASIVMGLSYASEWFTAWYAGERAGRSLVAFEFTGSYAPMFWALLFCNIAAPQAFWLGAVRRSVPFVFVLAILINIGMWLERILIIWNTLSHDYLPSSWRLYSPTIWDWLTMVGSLGLFALMFLVFVRLLPSISMHEVRHLVAEETEP